MAKRTVYSQDFYISIIKQNLSYISKIKSYVIIAFCLVINNERTGYIDIDFLCIKKEYQKKGIGKYFFLHIATTNLPGIKLYEKYDFNDKSPDKDPFFMKLIIGNIQGIKSDEKKETKKIREKQKNQSNGKNIIKRT